MKIRVIGHGGESQFPFGNSGPWSEFRGEIISQGHAICEEEFGAKTDALISHRHSDRAIQEANKNAVPLSHRALVLWEPKIVEKERYSKEVLDQYGIIYAPSPIWAKQVSGKSFNWPQDQVVEIQPLEDWIVRKRKFVIIQGNKFAAHKGELYSLRREVIGMFREKIDLYGTDWNKGVIFDWLQWSRSAIKSNLSEISFRSIKGIGRKNSNYFGLSRNKRETLLNYRFAIVIENSPDFVSEKLFDSISGGCVVIYIGPLLNDFAINDANLILAGQNRSEILQKCQEVMLLKDVDQYEIARKQNLYFTKISRDWENTRVLRLLARDIIQDMK